MTLEPYDSDALDRLALRVFDLSARLRALACRSRDAQLPSFPLNDRKTLEWLSKLEQWAHKAEAEMEMRILRERGANRARSTASD